MSNLNSLQLVKRLELLAIAPVVALSVCSSFAAVVLAQPLPGDAILECRVVSIKPHALSQWHWDLRLEVSYTYHVSHGRAIVGAGLLPRSDSLDFGHSFWGTQGGPEKSVDERRSGDLVAGVQRVSIAVRVNAPQVSTAQVRLFLYESEGGEFLSRSFPHAATWKRPTTASDERLPDLVISAGSHDPPGPVVSPGTVLRFSFQVTNRGNAAVAGTVVVSGPGNHSGSITGGLKPGETKVAILEYPLYSHAVTYTMRFVADPDNVIRESDEANNESAVFVVSTTY